jgi:hypothetical protein
MVIGFATSAPLPKSRGSVADGRPGTITQVRKSTYGTPVRGHRELLHARAATRRPTTGPLLLVAGQPSQTTEITYRRPALRLIQ